jgi:hypothetical protein
MEDDMGQRKPLKSNQLRDIRRREQDATPGPWASHEQVLDPLTTDKVITTEWVNQRTQYPEPIISISQSENRATLWILDGNANFIVGAREDIPQLLGSLDVFGHRVVYDALLHYFNNVERSEPGRQILEQAIETCWQIINDKSSKT